MLGVCPEFRRKQAWKTASAQSAKRKLVSPPPPEGAAWSAPTARNGRSEQVTTGIVAFANLGLPVDAVQGSLWDDNRLQLLQQVQEILSIDGTLGVCFGEVGTKDRPLGPNERKKFEEVMEEATNAIGITSWLYPTFTWPKADGNTFAMWRANAELEHLPPLTNLGTKAESFRSAEVFRLWLTEEASLLIFNHQQPITKEAPYRLSAKMAVCTGFIQAVMREQQEQPTNVGFICGGDARCDKHTWIHALLMQNCAQIERRFAPMQFVYARQAIADELEIKKHGDVYVALTQKEFVLRQRDCNIRNRDEEHDVILLDWRFSYLEWPRGATEHMEDRRVRPRIDKARDAEHSSASSARSNSSDESDESASEAKRSDEPRNAEESCDWSPVSDDDHEDHSPPSPPQHLETHNPKRDLNLDFINLQVGWPPQDPMMMRKMIG